LFAICGACASACSPQRVLFSGPGQQQDFPSVFHHSRLMLIPALLPLLSLMFCAVRLWFTDAYKKMYGARPRCRSSTA